MENTDKILFEDKSPQWYVALGERWIGPLAAAEVYEKILNQEITWAHYVWKAGQKEWQRICDTETFQAAVPRQPKEQPKPVVKQASRAPRAPQNFSEEKNWFLHYNDTQFGPFSQSEVDRFLRIGKLHGRVNAWKNGMEGWALLERISAFADAVEESKKARAAKKSGAPAAPSAPKEQRKGPRSPLVAKIFLARDPSTSGSVIVGVCRDISVGGMQVLAEKSPGKAGERVKMNVSPAGESHGKIQPFVAEGVIVRQLEDGCGFSFRFDQLSDHAKRSIEEYIGSSVS